jgi:hypothetical protein
MPGSAPVTNNPCSTEQEQQMATKKMTDTLDDKLDKKAGVKEGSKKDMTLDKKRGVPEDRNELKKKPAKKK